MQQSSPEPDNNTGINPPCVDHLLLDEDRDVHPRAYDDLVYGVMEQRDCSHPEAERVVADKGKHTVERELQERGLNSETWGGPQ